MKQFISPGRRLQDDRFDPNGGAGHFSGGGVDKTIDGYDPPLAGPGRELFQKLIGQIQGAFFQGEDLRLAGRYAVTGACQDSRSCKHQDGSDPKRPEAPWAGLDVHDVVS